MVRRLKIKNRKEAASYLGLPHAVLDSQNYLRLTAKAVKLLNDAGRQYNGINNGDICVTFSIMNKRGWISKATLQEALEELIHYGFLILTRQGGRHKASLYCISWRPINECKDKLDVKSTNVAPGDWKVVKEDYIPKRLLKKRCPNNRVSHKV